MSDDLIFREVDEEVRRDRYEALFRRYGVYLGAAAVLIVAGTVGFVVWQNWQQSEQLQQGGRFEVALGLLEADRPADAAQSFEALAAEGGDGYRALAGMQAAAARAAAGERAAALAAYDRLRADSSLPADQRDLAAIKAALIAIELEGGKAALDRISPVADGEGAFRNAAREIRAAALLKNGDRDAAIAELKALAQDASTGDGQRARVQQFLRALGA